MAVTDIISTTNFIRQWPLMLRRYFTIITVIITKASSFQHPTNWWFIFTFQEDDLWLTSQCKSVCPSPKLFETSSNIIQFSEESLILRKRNGTLLPLFSEVVTSVYQLFTILFLFFQKFTKKFLIIFVIENKIALERRQNVFLE